MYGKNTLYAYAMRNLAYNKGGVDASAGMLNYYSLIYLNTFFFTFTDLYLDFDRITGAEIGRVCPQLFIADRVEYIHDTILSFR
jgi:hypothetical protein